MMLHGMISLGPSANRIYVGYGTNAEGLLQIVDREKLLDRPKEATGDNLRYPEVGRFELSPLNGAHTTFPVLGMPITEFAKDKIGKVRNFVIITDKQIANECQEARQFVWFRSMPATSGAFSKHVRTCGPGPVSPAPSCSLATSPAPSPTTATRSS